MLNTQAHLSQTWQKSTHARVQVSDLSSLSIFVSDFDVLVGPRVNHHVPGVPVQPVSPVVVALRRRDVNKFFSTRRVDGTYLCDEVGVRHEKLLEDVHDCKNRPQLVLESWFGGSGARRALLAAAVNAGGAGPGLRRGERQSRPEESRETGEESSRPVGVAEERAGGQHGVREHP